MGTGLPRDGGFYRPRHGYHLHARGSAVRLQPDMDARLCGAGNGHPAGDGRTARPRFRQKPCGSDAVVSPFVRGWMDFRCAYRGGHNRRLYGLRSGQHNRRLARPGNRKRRRSSVVERDNLPRGGNHPLAQRLPDCGSNIDRARLHNERGVHRNGDNNQAGYHRHTERNSAVISGEFAYSDNRPHRHDRGAL